jgi:Ion transport protein
VTSSSLNAIKVFRLMKVVRPLRFVSRNQGLRISIRALGVALSGIVNALIIFIMFLFILGIIGINYFSGKFYDCDRTGPKLSLVIPLDTKWDCLNAGAEWKNSYLNFDNILNSMISLFIVANGISWQEIMYKATSIRAPDISHSLNNLENPIAAIFFLIVMIVGNFFL